MLCEVVMVHHSLLVMDSSSVRNKMFSVYVALVVDSVQNSPPHATVCPPALLLVQAAVTNKDLFLFCMVWGGDRQSCHCCGQVFCRG